MKRYISGLYENVFVSLRNRVKSLSALLEVGRAGRMGYTVISWELKTRAEIWRVDMPRYVTKRRPNRKKEAQGGSTARYNPGQREDMENKANILQMAKNKKKKRCQYFQLSYGGSQYESSGGQCCNKSISCFVSFVGSLKVSQISQIYLMLYTLSNEYGFIWNCMKLTPSVIKLFTKRDNGISMTRLCRRCKP